MLRTKKKFTNFNIVPPPPPSKTTAFPTFNTLNDQSC